MPKPTFKLYKIAGLLEVKYLTSYYSQDLASVKSMVEELVAYNPHHSTFLLVTQDDCSDHKYIVTFDGQGNYKMEWRVVA